MSCRKPQQSRSFIHHHSSHDSLMQRVPSPRMYASSLGHPHTQSEKHVCARKQAKKITSPEAALHFPPLMSKVAETARCHLPIRASCCSAISATAKVPLQPQIVVPDVPSGTGRCKAQGNKERKRNYDAQNMFSGRNRSALGAAADIMMTAARLCKRACMTIFLLAS